MYNPEFELDPNEMAVLACFHDVGEVISEDVNSLYKRLSPKIERLSRELEQESLNVIYNTLPDELKAEYKALIFQKEHQSVKAINLLKFADILSALAKASEELRCGNQDFKTPFEQLTIKANTYRKDFKSADYFIDKFLPAFSKSIDSMIELLE